jgi:hypothetical protein
MARDTDGDHGPEQQAQRHEGASEIPVSTGRPTRHGHGAFLPEAVYLIETLAVGPAERSFY